MSLLPPLMPPPELRTATMPGHWLLARLGKRVLRPGGVDMTTWMIEGLAIGPDDHVLELAPGLGATARLVLAAGPARYHGVDRDPDAVAALRRLVRAPHEVVQGAAHATGLPAGSQTAVFGEAMLTMNPDVMRRQIVAEAFRVLAPGGRYGIHELCLTPDDLDADRRRGIERELSAAIHVGARPITVPAWRALLEEAGFVVRAERRAPMHLLEPARFVRDEGVRRTGAFLLNVLRDAEARERVLGMRAAFRRHAGHLAAVSLVAVKPGAEARG